MNSKYQLTQEAKEYYKGIRDERQKRLKELENVNQQLKQRNNAYNILMDNKARILDSKKAFNTSEEQKDREYQLQHYDHMMNLGTIEIDSLKERKGSLEDKLQNNPVVPNSTYDCPDCNMKSIYLAPRVFTIIGQNIGECQLCDAQYKINKSGKMTKI